MKIVLLAALAATLVPCTTVSSLAASCSAKSGPQTAALVALLADACRVWDAIVVGEYGRAFYGSQYALMAPLFEHYGVQLWMPEAGGSEAPRRRRTRRGADARHHASPEDIIAALRNTDVTLTFDPAAGTLHAEGAAAIQIVTRKEAG